MNGIEVNYDKTVSVERLTAIAETETEEYISHISSLLCHIQPLDESFSEDQPGSFSKDLMMFCAVSDILENDRIVFESNNYLVVGVNIFNFLGYDRHMEVRIKEFST
jgi:hypothetical protein